MNQWTSKSFDGEIIPVHPSSPASPLSKSSGLLTLFIFLVRTAFSSIRVESSRVQVSRGRLLSHMLNLVTLPSGLYYARGLILIFRMAAMATRPSSCYTYICAERPPRRDKEEGSTTVDPRLHRSSLVFPLLASDLAYTDLASRFLACSV